MAAQAPALRLLHDMSAGRLRIPDLCRTSVMSAAVKSQQWDAWRSSWQRSTGLQRFLEPYECVCVCDLLGLFVRNCLDPLQRLELF